MKKFLLVFIAGIVLTGCGKKTIIQEKTEEFTGNLKEAMAKNLPMKCEWQQNENSGVSYVKGKDVYVETVNEGKKGFMIHKDDCTWTWGDEMEQGVKFCNEPVEEEKVEEADIETEPGEFKAEGLDWQMEYKCAPVVFGDDKFNPPAGVNFLDMQNMMQGLMK